MSDNDGLSMLLDQLVAGERECEWLEFKENYLDPQYLGKSISAIANSSLLHGKKRGYVIFGVRDSTWEIVGTKVVLAQEKVDGQELENWLHIRMRPKTDFRLHEFRYDDKKIAIIEIEPARDRPVTFDNEAYIRIGSYNKRLSDHPEKERKIWAVGDKLGFEKQIAKAELVENEVFALLDWEKYFELVGQQPPSDRRSLLQRLEQENLISITNQLGITNMGAVLFAKDLRKLDKLNRKTVRIIIYKSKGRLEGSRELEAVRGYAAGFNDLIARIEDQLPAREEIGSDGFRKTLKTYPSLAIREIVANLLIHQDFSISGAGPMVEIFSDRIGIY